MQDYFEELIEENQQFNDLIGLSDDDEGFDDCEEL